VPSDELRQRVAAQVTYEQVADLAREFQVSAMVIEHQLENHRIARIIDL
jgi:Zn-dependent peptidase ImmA (M78 family)